MGPSSRSEAPEPGARTATPRVISPPSTCRTLSRRLAARNGAWPRAEEAAMRPQPPLATETRSGALADAQGCERTREEAQEPRPLATGFETQAEPKPAAALAKWRRRVR
jgi:hypothetical protein